MLAPPSPTSLLPHHLKPNLKRNRQPIRLSHKKNNHSSQWLLLLLHFSWCSHTKPPPTPQKKKPNQNPPQKPKGESLAKCWSCSKWINSNLQWVSFILHIIYEVWELGESEYWFASFVYLIFRDLIIVNGGLSLVVTCRRFRWI